MANPIWHWELMVEDVQKAKAFYGRIFDWRFDDTQFPGYTLVDTGKEPGGGLVARPSHAPSPALNTYFHVAHIDDTLAKVTAAGGQVVVPRTEIPGVGWFAMFLDPDKIAIGLFEAPPTP